MGTYNDKEKAFFYMNEKLGGSKTVRSTRPTKDQTLINFKSNNLKMNLILNKRKLSELPSVILKFNENTEFILNALKKHVFFNYDFIYAKLLCLNLDYLRESENSLVDICNNLGSNQEGYDSIQNILALNTILLKYSIFLKKYPNTFIEQIRTRLIDHARNEIEHRPNDVYLNSLLNDNYKKVIDFTWKYNQWKKNEEATLSDEFLTHLVPMNTFLETNLNLNESVLFTVEDWNFLRFWTTKIINVIIISI